MYNKNVRCVRGLALLLLVFLVSCSDQTSLSEESETQHAPSKMVMINSFESADDLKNVVFAHVDMQEVQALSPNIDNKRALYIKLLARDNYSSSFEVTPKGNDVWNWKNNKPVRVALDIKNPSARSSQLFVAVEDNQQQTHNRSVLIPYQSEDTYYVELSGGDLDIETGIRSNTASPELSGTPFIWRWGVKDIDLQHVKSITFSVTSLLHDRELIIDNLRLMSGADYNVHNLKGISDQFGQNANVEFEGKIHSTEELFKSKMKEEQSVTGELLADRSRFGGWKDGPKLNGTGFFRVAKVKGKWGFVDPDGYLFFSHGIANVRMSNTSTITGVDFDQSLVIQREKGDLTPEDSLGLNPVGNAAEATSFVASDLRRNMFNWLPAYDDDLANHYGYRRTVHTGVLERGETYSFYRANLERKYGESTPESFIDNWRESTLNRMRSWGFTSFGNWVDPMFYGQEKVPYFANGWIIGDFKTVSSGNDYWSPLPDPFDPVFRERTKVTVEAIANEVKNNPWCIGVFIDNEKSWGLTGSIEGQYGLVINTLKQDASQSPTKAHFVAMLKSKYNTIENLNDVWGTSTESWQALAKGIDVGGVLSQAKVDLAHMLFSYSEKYFSVVKSELKKVMPNHLYMGARFADWGMTPEVVDAAAKHADVMSYNYYKEGLQKKRWAFLESVDKPSIIGEFHMGASDTGLLNPGLVHAKDQEERAGLYKDYMDSVISNPYFVGAHWFQYIDSPLTGRAYDGENYNVGFVNVTDTPYGPMVNAAKFVNSTLYPKRFSDTPR